MPDAQVSAGNNLECEPLSEQKRYYGRCVRTVTKTQPNVPMYHYGVCMIKPEGKVYSLLIHGQWMGNCDEKPTCVVDSQLAQLWGYFKSSTLDDILWVAPASPILRWNLSRIQDH